MSLPALDALPPLPQAANLRLVASTLWHRNDVIALWLGGSFGRGTADEYSDIDLRVAVRFEAEAWWREPDLGLLFGGEVVGRTSFPLDGGLLHHLALTGGDIYDLWVRSAEQDPPPENVLVLGCRDAAFARRLAGAAPPPAVPPIPADPVAVREAVASFWVNSLKHRKVLGRGLDLVAQKGVGMERDMLQRLWYIQETGTDWSTQRPTIHTLTQAARVVVGVHGRRALALTGGSLTNREEIIAAIEANREEVAVVGRRLAAALHFEYPDALEQTVRRTWRQFLSTEEEAES